MLWQLGTSQAQEPSGDGNWTAMALLTALAPATLGSIPDLLSGGCCMAPSGQMERCQQGATKPIFSPEPVCASGSTEGVHFSLGHTVCPGARPLGDLLLPHAAVPQLCQAGLPRPVFTVSESAAWSRQTGEQAERQTDRHRLRKLRAQGDQRGGRDSHGAFTLGPGRTGHGARARHICILKFMLRGL